MWYNQGGAAHFFAPNFFEIKWIGIIMSDEKLVEKLRNYGRSVEIAQQGDEDLGPLKLLPGVW